MVDVDAPKLLKCVLYDDVFCSYRKYEGDYMMARCEKCEQNARFNREMEEQDAQERDEVECIERLDARYKRGEITREEFRKGFFECGRGKSE